MVWVRAVGLREAMQAGVFWILGYTQALVWDVIIIIIIEGLSLLQSIPPTTADKQTQAQKKCGMWVTVLGARA